MNMFFYNLKSTILNLAVDAVLEAEKNFQSGEGALKKKSAIAFVVNALPVPALLKPLFTAVLGAFIDEAIELAVTALRKTQ